MRPQRHHAFGIDTVSKLDRLELVAALLERDAVNNRAWLTELGAIPERRPSRALRASRRWEKITGEWIDAARTGWAFTIAVAVDPRLHAGLRAAYRFCIDLIAVTAAAFVAIALIVATYLVLAPPV
ncbi:MAG TPA: hypothetical protein VNR88_07075 [Hyphomicrobium sp.]|nr:hypothetical protein [Hyphomicrobium sp.]